MIDALLLGVDVGTTHVKAALVAPDGHVLRIARRPTATHRLPDGGAVHRLDEILAAVDGVVRECVEAIPPNRRLAGIGIASMAEAGAPVDGDGRPLVDLLAWFDPRPAAEAAFVAAEVGPERLFALTGLRPEPKHSLPKLIWLRRNGGAAIAAAVAWAGVAELVGRALTGSLATTSSLACRTMLWDLSAGAWHPELLRLAGLRADDMPAVLPIDRPVGGLDRRAAFRFGLPSGIPVAIAGHDHLVGALGCGVVSPGQALDSLGTAEAVLAVTERPMLDEAVRLAGFSTGAHPVGGRHYLIAGLPAAGALIEWFVDTFLDGDRLAPEDRWPAFERLVEEAAGEAPTGIVVDPAWRGRVAPSPDASATGSIRGLRFEHGLADLARATLEGVAFQVRWMLETLERLAGRPIDDLTLIGAATASRPVLELRAALAARPARVAETGEAVSVGAALAGGLAAGALDDLDGALAARVPSRPLDVDAALAAAYGRAYREAFLPAVSPRPERA